MIDKLILFFKFFFIFRFKILPAALKYFIVHIVGMFHSGESVRRILPVEPVSGNCPFIGKFRFPLIQPVKLRPHLLAVRRFRTLSDLFVHFRGQCLILHESCRQLLQLHRQIPDIPLRRLQYTAQTNLLFLNPVCLLFPVRDIGFQLLLLVFKLRGSCSVFQLPKFFPQFLLLPVICFQLVRRGRKTQNLGGLLT